MMNKKIAAGVVAVVLLVGLASCASDGDEDEDDDCEGAGTTAITLVVAEGNGGGKSKTRSGGSAKTPKPATTKKPTEKPHEVHIDDDLFEECDD